MADRSEQAHGTGTSFDEAYGMCGAEATMTPAWNPPAIAAAPAASSPPVLDAAGGLDSYFGSLATGGDDADEGGEAILETGPLEQLLGVAGVVDEVHHMHGAGPLALAGAANTYLTHKPSTRGEVANLERGVAASSDLVFDMAAMAAGPLGVLDGASGGNLKGLVKGGATSLVVGADALVHGDIDGMERQSERLRSGENGVAAQAVAEVGHGLGTGLAAGYGALTGQAPPEEREARTEKERQERRRILAAHHGRGEVTFVPEAPSMEGMIGAVTEGMSPEQRERFMHARLDD